MFDLALSQDGDLIFVEKQTPSPVFKLSFTIMSTLKISFDASDFDPFTGDVDSIKLTLDVKNLDNNKRAMTVHDSTAKTQLLKIRLGTQLRELPLRQDIGSKLELARHKSLYDPKVLSLVQTYVKDAIIDIIPNVEVRATPVVNKSKKYAQQLNIYIFENDFLIFQFSFEG